MSRECGVIMHISSLPEDYGIGTLGEWAYQFADFLKQSGLTYWQILPLGHTGYGDSPYQSFSAFAGNPYFIDLKLLEKDGLLKIEDFKELSFGSDETKVDYGLLFENRFKLLEVAYQNAKVKLNKEFEVFKETNSFWIKDYAMYMAIKEKMGRISWLEWDVDIKLRKASALKHYEEELKEEIEFWIFVQYEFDKQWQSLKKYVNDLGIKIIGDIPIYVASDSSDAWAHSHNFKLDENKEPIVVAGCPPDAFSDMGQLWGNPIYDWEYLEKDNYIWWINRIRESLKLYDVIRIDHFRGFEAYWEIPYGEKTAIKGRWVQGPGMKLFEEIKKTLGEINVIAEDLGYLTQEVIDFREESTYPGMKVLQFAFNTKEESEYIPHRYIKNCIVYTGTHDNDTIIGWMKTTGDKEEVAHAVDYLKLTEEEGYSWGFIRGAWASIGDIAITQMQDFLELGNEARMNFPSTLRNNWTWRMKKQDLSKELAQKIVTMTKLYGRCKA